VDWLVKEFKASQGIDLAQDKMAFSGCSRPPRRQGRALHHAGDADHLPFSSTDTSNVPPPRSKTRIVWSLSLSSPYASARRRLVDDALHVEARDLAGILRPWRWSSLKYAGTVITAASTLSPRYASASVFSFCRIIALISGGEYCLPPASTRASPFGRERP